MTGKAWNKKAGTVDEKEVGMPVSDNATDVDRQRGREAVLPVVNSEHAISGTAHPSERLAVVDHGPCQNAGAMDAQDSDLRHTDVLPPCLRSLFLFLSLSLLLLLLLLVLPARRSLLCFRS